MDKNQSPEFVKKIGDEILKIEHAIDSLGYDCKRHFGDGNSEIQGMTFTVYIEKD